MSGDEPRRSVRSTKGVNPKNTEDSPAPTAKPTKSKSKPPKKSLDPEPEPDEEEDDERIRCVCGNDNPKDKRAFIGCDACGVWQHNVCMGVTDDSDDIPDHYFCEECQPQDHQETLQSKENDSPGSYVWEKRNKIYQNEKKMSKSRKSKGREDGKPGWLKRDGEAASTPQSAQAEPTPPPKEAGGKRKREESAEEVKEEEAPEPKKAGRGDKRRKSSAPQAKDAPDPEHAIVPIDQLPPDRQKVAGALSKIVEADLEARVKAGHKLGDDQTPKTVGGHYGSLIEYALHMNHGSNQSKYSAQFRVLNANLKKNKMLIERLLNDSLTADDLAKMKSEDLANETLQKERAAMKAELDRQAVVVEEEGPKYRNTHKGPEKIEETGSRVEEPSYNAQPVRERTEAEGETAGSPVVGQAASPVVGAPATDTQGSPGATAGADRRTSSQTFDMNNVWAKAAHSPTTGGPGGRPMQMPPRRKSSIVPKPEQEVGAKVDADVDRMLADNDDSYEPTEFTSDSTVVWRGKLVQSTGDGEPTVNARFVAGRDLASTIAWDQLLPAKLGVDGRLQISKAEEYLCGLEWSNTSDVSVLCLTPYDDADAFNAVFSYFHSRQRYAVISKGLPALVKDLYIIPVEVGASLPDHVQKLEHCTIKTPIESRILLATFVVARSPDTPRNAAHDSNPAQRSGSTNGHHIPPHVQPGAPGPAGSPITGHTPSFSPSTGGQNKTMPTAGYGAPNPFPPNPYGPSGGEQHHLQQNPPKQQHPGHPNPAVHDILGPFQTAPTAQQILAADPTISVDMLQNLRRILEEEPATREDIGALALKLGAGLGV